MRFKRTWPNASHRRKSFEIDRLGEMAAKPVDHTDEIGGQGGGRHTVDGPVVALFNPLFAAFSHHRISKAERAAEH